MKLVSKRFYEIKTYIHIYIYIYISLQVMVDYNETRLHPIASLPLINHLISYFITNIMSISILDSIIFHYQRSIFFFFLSFDRVNTIQYIRAFHVKMSTSNLITPTIQIRSIYTRTKISFHNTNKVYSYWSKWYR